MTDWSFLKQVRMVSQRLTPILPPDCQARIEARLKHGMTGIYHERQRGHLCLLHSLNNLLQGKAAFTQKELDGIADWLQSTFIHEDTTFSSSDPSFVHRSTRGDYSTNVLYEALDSRNMTAIWYDDPQGFKGLPPMASYGDKLVGILLFCRLGARTTKGHWVAIRMLGGQWYNLDSFLDEPCILPDGEEDLNTKIKSALRYWGRAAIVLDDDVGGDVVNSSQSDPALSEAAWMQLMHPRCVESFSNRDIEAFEGEEYDQFNFEETGQCSLFESAAVLCILPKALVNNLDCE